MQVSKGSQSKGARGLWQRRNGVGDSGERGIALLVVVTALTLLTTVVADFQFNSRVDLQLAFNARDELQAEYNALSALRMRAVILKQSRRLSSALQGFLGDAAPPIGQVLESLPIECGVMSAVIREAESSLLDESDGGDFFQGECLATSQSEHSKISINMLRNNINNRSKQVTQLLMGMLADPQMERHYQEDDANGTHAESPEELVAAIIDWIDADDNQANNQVADEDRHYAYLKDSYRVKNAPFDSVDELQLVHGIDDEMFKAIKGHISIYSDSTQIELTTAPNERIFLGLCVAALSFGYGCLPVIQHPAFPQFWMALTELRQLGGMAFGILNVAALTALLQQYGLTSVLDPQVIPKVFTDRPGSTWYTIEAEGRVGNASKRMRAVFQAVEGQFYYFRVE